MRLGFACAWDPRPEPTWSYTPWRLRDELRTRTDVVDIGMRYPTAVRLPLKAAHARRVNGQWVSMWKHSRLARGYARQALLAGERMTPCDVVIQIQDLAALRTPYLVLQDLSYDVLLAELDAHGRLVHFPSLTRSDAQRLRDRQHRIYGAAAGILAMSEWFADHLVRVSGVPADRVHVVHPGASAVGPAISDGPDVVRERPRRRLLFVGKDFATKAGEQVVAALAVLRADVDPKITLTVVGPKEWPMPGEPPAGVRFLGRVPIERVGALYAEHDLFVMPSRFEGFGIALVEALSHGLPAVARRAFAMPEIVRPGDNGDLVTGDDPAELAGIVARLLADDGLFARVAEQAVGVREHYSWARAADDVIKVAEKLSCRR
ncbi:MAG TPA: glycosyltransferase family 4 protein [Pseudonocardiaceae bacterium]|nr:glycosyltransferase family 4 protein [Pseudonocardiaceae bacterium]